MENLKWRKIIPGKKYDELLFMIDVTHRNYARTGYGTQTMGTATHYIPMRDLENMLTYEK